MSMPTWFFYLRTFCPRLWYGNSSTFTMPRDMMPRSPRLYIAVFTLALLWTGCAPSLSPLYRDYSTPAIETEAAVRDSIRHALIEAGWQVTAAKSSQHLTTEPKTFSNWGIYKTIASLEVVPTGTEHVRLYIHPFRRYFTGGQTKIMYLPSSLEEEIVPALNTALEERGLKIAGTPFERDDASLSR